MEPHAGGLRPFRVSGNRPARQQRARAIRAHPHQGISGRSGCYPALLQRCSPGHILGDTRIRSRNGAPSHHSCAQIRAAHDRTHRHRHNEGISGRPLPLPRAQGRPGQPVGRLRPAALAFRLHRARDDRLPLSGRRMVPQRRQCAHRPHVREGDRAGRRSGPGRPGSHGDPHRGRCRRRRARTGSSRSDRTRADLPGPCGHLRHRRLQHVLPPIAHRRRRRARHRSCPAHN